MRLDLHASKAWCLLHDNAPSQNALLIRQFLAKKNVTMLHHPSPDLAPGWLLFIHAPQDSPERSSVWWYVGDPESCNTWTEGDSGLRPHPRPRSVGWSRLVVCWCGRGVYWIKYTCFAILSGCRFFRASVLKLSCHTVYEVWSKSKVNWFLLYLPVFFTLKCT